MRNPLFVIVTSGALLAGPHFATAADNNSGRYKGGADIGPLGQCFNPPDCGGRRAANGYRGRASFAESCPIVRERFVTDDGRVIFRRHRAC
jgi:hypothetical protein